MSSEPTGPNTKGSGRLRRPVMPPADVAGRALSLGILLFLTWLMLSGYFQAFLLSLGVASCVLVVFIALRMDVADREAHPIHLSLRVICYWFWLLKEIWLAAIDVTKRVLAPKPNISPVLIELQSSQKTELGQVIYANSITLTPGTYTIRVSNGRLLVHALSREAAEALAEGEMDRRVTNVEGEA